MKTCLLVIALSVSSCGEAGRLPEVEQPPRDADTKLALNQILREIQAGKTPVGRLDLPPSSAKEAIAGLLAMGVGGYGVNAPSVVAHEGFWICSFAPLERPYWGQRGHAVSQQTGDVYAWSLW
jgi:hypothetical protein